MMDKPGRKRKSTLEKLTEVQESMDSKRSKAETLEVTGVSRSGRVRKKSSKLMDFEYIDEMENRHKRKQAERIERPVTPKPRKMPKAKPKVDQEDEGGNQYFAKDNQEKVETFNNHADSDTDSDIYQPRADEDADDEDYDVDENDEGDDDDDDDDDDDNDEDDDVVDEDVADDDGDDDDDEGDDDDDDVEDDDYVEGQLVVDEKTPTQSLYMMEKSKKKLLIKDGKVVGTRKAQRKDKGKARFTAYMMWAKEIRKELTKQYPDMDFTTMARRLSELWGTVPNSERELWRRKAKREASKRRKPKQEAPLMPSRKFINKKGGPIQPPLSNSSVNQTLKVSPPESQQPAMPMLKKIQDSVTSPGLYKVTGIAPIDVAAHLKLLGESLFIIGERLQEHEGQIAVSGSLSVLLDSLLCALGPLLCLTEQLEEIKSNKQVLTKILQNVAYMMPGLG